MTGVLGELWTAGVFVHTGLCCGQQDRGGSVHRLAHRHLLDLGEGKGSVAAIGSVISVAAAAAR